MTIDEIHSFIKFLANTGQNRYFSPEEIDRAINASQIDKFNEEKSNLHKTRKISDELRVFWAGQTLTLISGEVSLPSNYDTILSVIDSTNSVNIEMVDSSEYQRRRFSDIEAPSAEYPICNIRQDYISVRPSSSNNIFITYIKKPNEVEWAYTTSGNDYVYDSNSSINLEWPDTAHIDIVLRSCVYLGIPIDDTNLSQLKAYKKQTEGV